MKQVSSPMTAQEVMDQEWMMPNTPDSEVLWGGERGPGLVYVVEQLVTTVANLATTVADLSKVVSGNEGLQQQVSQLKLDIELRHKSNERSIDRLWQVAIPFMVAIALGVVTLLWRATVIAETHHL